MSFRHSARPRSVDIWHVSRGPIQFKPRLTCYAYTLVFIIQEDDDRKELKTAGHLTDGTTCILGTFLLLKDIYHKYGKTLTVMKWIRSVKVEECTDLQHE